MSKVVEAGILATFRARLRVDGVEVSYHRGTGSIDTLKAIKGASSFNQNNFDPLSGGFIGFGKVETVDFTAATEDLVIDGQAITPQSGDLIKWRVGNEVITHEVLPIGDEPESRPDDRFHQTTLIHTKEFDREAF